MAQFRFPFNFATHSCPLGAPLLRTESHLQYSAEELWHFKRWRADISSPTSDEIMLIFQETLRLARNDVILANPHFWPTKISPARACAKIVSNLRWVTIVEKAQRKNDRALRQSQGEGSEFRLAGENQTGKILIFRRLFYQSFDWSPEEVLNITSEQTRWSLRHPSRLFRLNYKRYFRADTSLTNGLSVTRQHIIGRREEAFRSPDFEHSHASDRRRLLFPCQRVNWSGKFCTFPHCFP